DRYGRDIPPPLRNLVERALKRDPEERFPSAGEFRDALLDYLYEQRVRVGPRELGAFLAQLQVHRAGEAPSSPGAQPPAGAGLDGPVTQAQREAEEARKEALVRASKEPAVVREAAIIAASVTPPPRMAPEGSVATQP